MFYQSIKHRKACGFVFPHITLVVDNFDAEDVKYLLLKKFGMESSAKQQKALKPNVYES